MAGKFLPKRDKCDGSDAACLSPQLPLRSEGTLSRAEHTSAQGAVTSNAAVRACVLRVEPRGTRGTFEARNFGRHSRVDLILTASEFASRSVRQHP